MLVMICREIHLRKDYLEGEKITSIYFGGGTPSLLTGEEIKNIFAHITDLFSTDAAAEITLEANPDDLTQEKITAFLEAGINRLSIGVQSFIDRDLAWMNRSHTAVQAEEAIANAYRSGFTNISADLIYGIPEQSDEEWKNNILKMISLPITHLSCYALTVEPGTALNYFIESRKMQGPEENKTADQFYLLKHILEENGFEQYEISNFCRDSQYAKHNSSYWKGEPYLGIGPSAHSYNRKSRQWNIANNAAYMESLERNIIPFEKEDLSEAQVINELIMTSLRTKWGLDLQQLAVVSRNNLERILHDADVYLRSGDLIRQNEKLKISTKGIMIADRIIADLFVDT